MGKVYLVGAGPGDPELLTRKAARLLEQAGIVFHDSLVSREVLALIAPEAEVIDVGKRCGRKLLMQDEINSLLVSAAANYSVVVRLKGGDPLIFGRAGEEIETLRRHNIAFEIVPGVTSAMGAAAAAQIPLTHRRASSALVLITAHRASEKDAAEKDAWSKFVASGATLVIYMPGQNYSDIAQRLRTAGLAGETPCAVISRATTKYQRTHRTTVLELHRSPQLAAPTLLVVGEVVRMADPAVLVEGLVIPDLSKGSDGLHSPALFKTSLSQAPRLGTDKEPVA